MRLSPRFRPTALALLTVITLLGCAGEAEISGSAREATTTPSPYVRPGLTRAIVARVVDGDTIRVEIEGQEYRVRYIGIDTPETVDPRRPVGCFGKEASERNRQLVEGQTVGLEKDISETDSFDRLLRYVWVADRMINATLVEEGYALASTYPPDVRYSDQFAALQAQAREASRGLWGAACAAPTAAP
jgi:micrococcal nuclease